MVVLLPFVLASEKVFILTPSCIISKQLAADFGSPTAKTSFFLKCGFFNVINKKLKNLVDQPLVTSPDEIDDLEENELVIFNAQKFSGKSRLSLSNQDSKDGVARMLRQFDTIIVDEAHHYPAATWNNIINEFEGKKVVFLTATPFRGSEDNDEWKKLIVKMETVFEIDLCKLEGVTIRRSEFVSRSCAYAPFGPNFLSKLKIDIEEYLNQHYAQDTRASQRKPQAMLLVRRRTEAIAVAQFLGDEATYVTSDRHGTRNLDDFTKGIKRIVVVCEILREGYDNPNVTLVLILRNCQSRVLFDQFCGRCIRIRRDLTGQKVDSTRGTVMSYDCFGQAKMWDARMKKSDSDPCEESESD